MKARAVDADGFRPVKIELTFETQEEYEAFYSVMNHSAVCDALEKHSSIDTGDIRSALDHAGRASGKHLDMYNIFDDICKSIAKHGCISEEYR